MSVGRDLGKLAELELEQWAAQVNITAHRPNPDVEGWDILLQFPESPADPSIPLDLRTPRTECFVQVKATETAEQREPIKLSNWEKFVNTPFPAFFLVFVYGTDQHPHRAYLIHVGKEWIGKVLKRLRSVPNDKKSQLHKQTLDLTWSDRDKLDTLDGSGLRAAIQKYVGRFDTYIQEKHKIRTTVGMDNACQISVTSLQYRSSAELYKDWVSFAIGEKDALDVSKILVEENVRFGIPAKQTEIEGGFIVLGERPSSPVRVLVSNSSRIRSSVLQGKIITPNFLFPGEPVPAEHHKVRIATEIGDFLIYPFAEQKIFECSFKIAGGDGIYRLGELANRWRVVSILHFANSEGCFFEVSDGKNLPVTLFVEQAPGMDPAMLEIAEAIEQAWLVAKRFDISPDTEVTLPHLLGQITRVKQVREWSDVNTPIHAIGGCVVTDSSQFDGEYAVVIPRVIHFGKVKLIVFIGFAAPLTITHEWQSERSFEMRNPKRVLLESHQLEMIDKEQFILMLGQTYEKLSGQGYSVIDFPE